MGDGASELSDIGAFHFRFCRHLILFHARERGFGNFIMRARIVYTQKVGVIADQNIDGFTYPSIRDDLERCALSGDNMMNRSRFGTTVTGAK